MAHDYSRKRTTTVLRTLADEAACRLEADGLDHLAAVVWLMQRTLASRPELLKPLRSNLLDLMLANEAISGDAEVIAEHMQVRVVAVAELFKLRAHGGVTP